MCFKKVIRCVLKAILEIADVRTKTAVANTSTTPPDALLRVRWPTIYPQKETPFCWKSRVDTSELLDLSPNLRDLCQIKQLFESCVYSRDLQNLGILFRVTPSVSGSLPEDWAWLLPLFFSNMLPVLRSVRRKNRPRLDGRYCRQVVPKIRVIRVFGKFDSPKKSSSRELFFFIFKKAKF